jgi:hypothetical protein
MWGSELGGGQCPPYLLSEALLMITDLLRNNCLKMTFS